MARTTATEVRQIMDQAITITDPNIDAFIAGANALVTKIYENDTQLGNTLKEQIEMWITAHMIASTVERMPAKAKGGPAEVTYTGKWGYDLTSTSYGQTAMTLDFTGKLRTVSSGKMAYVYAVPGP